MIRQPATRGLVPSTIHRCGVGLGANVGDRLQALRWSAQALGHLADFSQPVLKSAVYETAPVGCAPGTPAFLNAVMEIGYFGLPQVLLGQLRAIEQAMGRPGDRERNQPRPIDLDLLYADGLEVQTAELELPHPRMVVRRFVLQPLCDIRPDLRLPKATRTVRELLAALPTEEPVPALVTREW